MKTKLSKTLDKIFHDMSIAELKLLYTKNSPGDISYHDTLYLNIIEGHPNQYTSSKIADLLQITRPSVTQKINELCKKGYVVRTQSETDKRVHYLSLNKDNSFFSNFHKDIEQKSAQLLTEKYGEKNVDLVCEMLEFFSDSVNLQVEKAAEI